MSSSRSPTDSPNSAMADAFNKIDIKKLILVKSNSNKIDLKSSGGPAILLSLVEDTRLHNK